MPLPFVILWYSDPSRAGSRDRILQHRSQMPSCTVSWIFKNDTLLYDSWSQECVSSVLQKGHTDLNFMKGLKTYMNYLHVSESSVIIMKLVGILTRSFGRSWTIKTEMRMDDFRNASQLFPNAIVPHTYRSLPCMWLLATAPLPLQDQCSSPTTTKHRQRHVTNTVIQGKMHADGCLLPEDWDWLQHLDLCYRGSPKCFRNREDGRVVLMMGEPGST